MKKLALVLLLLPVISSANSTSYWEIEHTAAKGEFDMHGVADEYSINFLTIGDRYASKASYVIADFTGNERDYQVDIDIKASVRDFSKGSFYIGYALKFYGSEFLHGLEGDDILDTVLLGYAKYNSKGIGFDVVASLEDDGDSSLGITLRNPIGKNGAGLLLGISDDEVGTSTSFGYSYAF
jgi:hypothetical protein